MCPLYELWLSSREPHTRQQPLLFASIENFKKVPFVSYDTAVSTVALFFLFFLFLLQDRTHRTTGHYTDVSVDFRGVYWIKRTGPAVLQQSSTSQVRTASLHTALFSFHFISFFASLTATKASVCLGPGSTRPSSPSLTRASQHRGSIFFGFPSPSASPAHAAAVEQREPGDRGNCCSVCSHFCVLFLHLSGLATLPRAKRARISL